MIGRSFPELASRSVQVNEHALPGAFAWDIGLPQKMLDLTHIFDAVVKGTPLFEKFAATLSLESGSGSKELDLLLHGTTSESNARSSACVRSAGAFGSFPALSVKSPSFVARSPGQRLARRAAQPARVVADVLRGDGPPRAFFLTEPTHDNFFSFALTSNCAASPQYGGPQLVGCLVLRDADCTKPSMSITNHAHHLPVLKVG